MQEADEGGAKLRHVEHRAGRRIEEHGDEAGPAAGLAVLGAGDHATPVCSRTTAATVGCGLSMPTDVTG